MKRMKRFASRLCAVLLVALALSGCGSRQTHEEYLLDTSKHMSFTFSFKGI